MAKTVKKKTVMTHPETKREMKVDAAIYESIKAAITQSLKNTKGKTFTELTDDVVKIIRKKIPEFKGSIPWYTISTRLDLETRGVVETFIEKGKKLNRLKK
jgi:methionyl-tRNA synthetase